MALLTAQQVVVPSTTPTYGAVASTDTMIPDDRMFLIVKNGGGSIDNVAVVISGNTEFGLAAPDIAVAVPATTGERWILVTPRMADPATGLVTVTHSFTTTVTCALVRI